MKYTVLPNGNLEIALSEPQDHTELQDILNTTWHKDHGFLAELLEYTGWEANGHLYQVNPEDVAALTDAPILTDDLTVEDDGKRTVNGRLWWYPDYAVKNFAEELIKEGRTEFIAAPPA